MSELEPEVERLLEALHEAARDNRQADFDRLERALLERFPAGFSSMPDAVHARYLEVDRAWPSQPPSAEDEPGTLAALGPRMPLSARIPALLLDWLHEQATRTQRARSDVVTACLRLCREDPELLARLDALLRRRE